MKKLLLISFLLLAAVEAKAECTCACIGGKSQAICTGSFNIAPICPPMICPQ